MINKIILGLLLLCAAAAPFAIHNVANAGGVQCQTYACQQAQQEIQYLYDAIWYERQKQYPNWDAIRRAEERIRWLMTIR